MYKQKHGSSKMVGFKATIPLSKDLWREFQVFVRINNTTASKEVRNFIRRKLGKAESEMEE